jgi:uncharacterized protein (UPF0276 family)
MSTATGRLFGLGLRKPHYASFLDGSVPVDFVEVISENFMFDGGRPMRTLAGVREHYPVALHGVSMSLGSADGLKTEYLSRLQSLVQTAQPLFVSDHLCWTGVRRFNSHDLLPLPYTEEALEVVSRNLIQAQETLGRQILIENPSSYIAFDGSDFSECEFLYELCQLTGCGLLLDVNNVLVSAKNHGFDSINYIRTLRTCDIKQIHLAGHDDSGALRIDTHDRPVCEDVWDLYRFAVALLPNVATMVERDDAIPPVEELLEELGRARAIAAGAPVRIQ